MVLPYEQYSITFDDITYSVDMPVVNTIASFDPEFQLD